MTQLRKLVDIKALAPIPNSPATREAWFEDAVEALATHFELIGLALPPVKISCSWPGGGSARKRAGECWTKESSAAGINEIFITPLYSDPIDVLAILMHELIHAADNCVSKHGAWFGKAARALGLEGKLTATHAGPALRMQLGELAEILGPYPHDKMRLPAKKEKAATSRTLVCGECEFSFSASIKKLEAAMSTANLVCPACRMPLECDSGE